MNRSNPFAANGLFKPPTHLLGSLSNNVPAQRRRTPSLDDSDTEINKGNADEQAVEKQEIPRSNYLTPDISSEQSSVPSIESSRSPSPFTTTLCPVQSEHEREIETEAVAQSRPLLDEELRSTSSSRHHRKRGVIRRFCLGTTDGWTMSSGILVCWVGGCQSGLLLVNGSILKDGPSKFSYPLMTTLIQLVVAHILILAAATLTRRFESSLRSIGLDFVVAPSQAPRKTRPTRYRSVSNRKSSLALLQRLTNGYGGISGGGMLEWQQRSVKHVFPAALIFTLKIVLSNSSYAHAVLPVYTLSRMATVPLTLLFTTLLMKTPHSVQTLSSAMSATLALLIATAGLGLGFTWGIVTAGTLSSIFAALYPIALLRAYKQILTDLVPQGNALVFKTGDDTTVMAGRREETRAYWRILHYLSTLSISLTLPLVLLSGELWQVHSHFHMVDATWFWLSMGFGGALGCAVFSTTLLLVKATSPLTANFYNLPRGALQLVLLGSETLPMHSWIGICGCWASCLWYMLARASEGNGRGGRRS